MTAYDVKVDKTIVLCSANLSVAFRVTEKLLFKIHFVSSSLFPPLVCFSKLVTEDFRDSSEIQRSTLDAESLNISLVIF